MHKHQRLNGLNKWMEEVQEEGMADPLWPMLQATYIIRIDYAAKVDYTTNTSTRSVFTVDLDGDGKADLAVANYVSNSVSFIRNNLVFSTPTITNFTPTSGLVGNILLPDYPFESLYHLYKPITLHFRVSRTKKLKHNLLRHRKPLSFSGIDSHQII